MSLSSVCIALVTFPGLHLHFQWFQYAGRGLWDRWRSVQGSTRNDGGREEVKRRVQLLDLEIERMDKLYFVLHVSVYR